MSTSPAVNATSAAVAAPQRDLHLGLVAGASEHALWLATAQAAGTLSALAVVANAAGNLGGGAAAIFALVRGCRGCRGWRRIGSPRPRPGVSPLVVCDAFLKI
jgi:hypothetical protein